MPRNRLSFPFAVLLMTVTIGHAVAQAPARAPSQQEQDAAELERLRRQVAAQQQQPQVPQPQPIYIVPAPQSPPPPAGPRPDVPTVELAPLLERVERASNKRFLVDVRHGPRIYLGGVEPNDVTYPVLLAIFRLNGFAAFESGGFVNIVPDALIRFHAPIVQADDAALPAEMYVTRVLRTVNVNTSQLVPILRPLLPQSAHLAAHLDNSQLIVMDRYENVKRISEIVRSLDVPSRD
jgi:type II secretory pathway component GspD/PulD (secretin)